MASSLPIEGKEIRFAPGRGGEPLTAFCRVWAQGNEVYAAARSAMGEMHLSVHASGQVHFRLAAKQKQDLAPLAVIGVGPWLHAFEMRFLVSEDALRPIGQRESLKKKIAQLIRTPEGQYLYVNLLIGAKGIPLNTEPAISGQTIWRTRLKDKRTAVLVGRFFDLSQENRDHLRHFREDGKITITLSGGGGSKYVEIYHVHWSTSGGNVINVIPLWEDFIRYEQEPLGDVAACIKTFRFVRSLASAELIAPNGRRVATVQLTGVDQAIDLTKNVPKEVEIGLMSLRLDAANLIAGSKIKVLEPVKLLPQFNISGAAPDNGWEYTIRGDFDGSRLSVNVDPVSAGLQNKKLSGPPVTGLGDDEEIVIVAPVRAVTLDAALDSPTTSTKLFGRFVIRDRK